MVKKPKLYSKEFQFQVLCAICQDPIFRMDFLMDLESSMFEFPYDEFLTVIQTLVAEDFFSPTQTIIDISNRLEQLGVSEKKYVQEAKRMFKNKVEVEYVKERVINFLKEIHIKELLPNIPSLVMNNKISKVMEEFEYIMSLGASKFNSVNLADLDLVREEIMKRYSVESMVSTGLPSLDDVFYGGFAPGEIHVIQAPPKSGKSAYAVNSGAINLLLDKKVLHVTLELTQHEVLMRYIQRIANITYPEILKMSEEEWGVLKERVFNKVMKDNLYILYYPEKSASVFDIITWLVRQKHLRDWTPDFIIVDYDDCLLPSTGTKESLYENSGDIYTDLIKLAVKWQVPILTFSQPVRDAWTKPNRGEVIEPSDLAHSARKAHRSWSISSLNFQPNSQEGTFYLGFNRRGKSGVKIPIKRALDVMSITELNSNGG